MKHIIFLVGILLASSYLKAQTETKIKYKTTFIQERINSKATTSEEKSNLKSANNTEVIIRPGETEDFAFRYDYSSYNVNQIYAVVATYEIATYMNLELTFFNIYNNYATVEFDISVSDYAPFIIYPVSIKFDFINSSGAVLITENEGFDINTGAPLAKFSGSPKIGIVPHVVSFKDESAGSYNSREWNFGDGQISNLENPQHKYIAPGIYDVSLIVSGDFGKSSITYKNFITAEGLDLFNFSKEVNTIPFFSAEGIQIIDPLDNREGNSSPSHADTTIEVHCFESISSNFSSINVGYWSTPFFVDIDNDNDMDLFVGESEGNIYYYRNNGTISSPSYELVTNKFENINTGDDSAVEFVDIDNDGDYDLFVGGNHKGLKYYKNVGDSNNFEFELISDNFEGLGKLGGNTTYSSFVDIDNDSDYDLFLSYRDNLFYYKNIGTPENCSFILIDSEFAGISSFGGGIDFFDYDWDGDDDLCFGGNTLQFYINSGTSTNPKFYGDRGSSISTYSNYDGSPTYADLNNDGILDLFAGGFNGKIEYFQGDVCTDTLEISFYKDGLQEFIVEKECGGFSSPSFIDIDNDTDLDIFIGTSYGNLIFYRNTGDAENPAFKFESNSVQNIHQIPFQNPAFADLDNDKDFDLVLGDKSGTLKFYRNQGNAEMSEFVFDNEDIITINYSYFLSPGFFDFDTDSDLDLLLGTGGNRLSYFRNVGTPVNPIFNYSSENAVILDGKFCSPTFGDLDYDGDFDMLVGAMDGNISYFQNVGTSDSSIFSLIQTDFSEIHESYSKPVLADIDSDNDLDLFVGIEDGGLLFFRNMTQFIPKIYLSETSVYFDSVLIGDTVSFNIDVYNLGLDSLVLEEISVLKANPALVLGLLDDPPIILQPNKFFEFSIQFTPDVETTLLDSIVIKSTDPENNIVHIPIRGFGETPKPKINVSNSFIEFEFICPGDSLKRSINIKSIGTKNLDISVMEIISDSDVFTIINPDVSPHQLEVGYQESISILYKPSLPGTYSGNLLIHSNDPENPEITISLTGNTFYVNTTVIQTDNTLTAEVDEAAYQWLNCDDA
ncbi:MAG: FG-GAP-like repeat-containing protein, partial [Bacteroidota bacterium]